jgi:hypothetical protein
VIPYKEDVIPYKEDVIPYKEDVIPYKEDVIPYLVRNLDSRLRGNDEEKLFMGMTICRFTEMGKRYF